MNRQSIRQQFYDSRPKFVMQFSRQQPVPRLVSINESKPFQSININSNSNNKSNKNMNNMNNMNNMSNMNSFHQMNSINNTLIDNTTILTQNFSTITSNPNPHATPTIPRKQLASKQRNYRLQVLQLQKQLSCQVQQKIQLQQIIKQLTIKSQRLKQINQHLIQRLKQVQKNYISNRMQLSQEYEVQLKKQKDYVYAEIEEYIKYQVNKLRNSMKQQKMNRKIQQKLEEFMEELLQINQKTVQVVNKTNRKNNNSNHNNTYINNINNRYNNNNKSVLIDIQNIPNITTNQPQQLQKSDQNRLSTQKPYRNSKPLLSDEKRSSYGPQPSDYNAILTHLDRQRNRIETSQSFYNSGSNNNLNKFRTSYKEKEERNNSLTAEKSMFRYEYSTTPHKRKRIFQND